MITLRVKAEVRDDRRVVLTLPPEVPTGPADLVITVESANGTGAPPRGVPAAAVRGIAAGAGEPADDTAVEQLLQWKGAVLGSLSRRDLYDDVG